MVLFPAPAGPSMAMMSFFSGILFLRAHQGNRRAGDRSQVSGDGSQVGFGNQASRVKRCTRRAIFLV